MSQGVLFNVKTNKGRIVNSVPNKLGENIIPFDIHGDLSPIIVELENKSLIYLESDSIGNVLYSKLHGDDLSLIRNVYTFPDRICAYVLYNRLKKLIGKEYTLSREGSNVYFDYLNKKFFTVENGCLTIDGTPHDPSEIIFELNYPKGHSGMVAIWDHRKKTVFLYDLIYGILYDHVEALELEDVYLGQMFILKIP